MEFEQAPRQMYDLEDPVPCSRCEKPISRLPFKPDPSRFHQIKCLDCYKASKGTFQAR